MYISYLCAIVGASSVAAAGTTASSVPAAGTRFSTTPSAGTSCADTGAIAETEIAPKSTEATPSDNLRIEKR